MYLCTANSNESPSILPGNSEHEIQFLNNVVEGNAENVHLDLDGGDEEPAVTTDVMFSGIVSFSFYSLFEDS